eukprot:XP_012815562.1 PREDICTED: tubulin monoglycylase TTLL3-like [Xenopus tropicalis]
MGQPCRIPVLASKSKKKRRKELEEESKEPQEPVEIIVQTVEKSNEETFQQNIQEPLEKPSEVVITETPTVSSVWENCLPSVQKTIQKSKERLKRRRAFKAKVEAAIEKKNIFWLEYEYHAISNGLKRRGWLQKTAPTFNAGAFKTTFSDPSRSYEYKMTLWYDVQPNLIWSRPYFNFRDLNEDQMINNFDCTRCFTTKVGLCLSLRELPWFAKEDPHTFYPRCHILAEERQEFIDDYRLTAARSILKWVLRVNGKSLRDEEVIPEESEKEASTAMCLTDAKMSDPGHERTVPNDIIVTALLACKMHLDTLEHKNIDGDLEPVEAQVAARWKAFLRDYYKVVRDGAHIQNSEMYVEHCRSILRKLEPVTPQLDIDGEKNIWILKPGFSSRGRGIYCENRMKHILRLVDSDPEVILSERWVAQKYVERPLLIHEAKIDLRQHFLITDWNPLTIWFYKDSFIRFSSQPFTLEKLDRAIHLCNNAIQRKLENAPNRHPDLPEENMWHSDEFKAYLRTIGKEYVWDSVIIPGMKKALIHTMQVSQDKTDYRKNSFDLFGADFMFGENFQPWLLEINYKPDIKQDTSVMEILVPPLLEDLLRVVIDYKNDPNCDVGGFELIYKQAKIEAPTYTIEDLTVRGISVKNPAL